MGCFIVWLGVIVERFVEASVIEEYEIYGFEG